MRNLAIAVISLHFASWGWAGAEYRSHPRSPLGEFRAGARASPNPPEAPSSTHLPANALKPETVRAAAEKALAELSELITAENFRELGLEALGETTRLVPGEPMALYEIQLNSATQAAAGETGRMPASRQVLVPIELDFQTRLGLVLSRELSDWKVVTFGNSRFTRRVAEVRRRTAEATGLPASAFALVSWPRLNAHFLGYEQAGIFKLAAAWTPAELKWEVGQSRPAVEAFALLAALWTKILVESHEAGHPVAR